MKPIKTAILGAGLTGLTFGYLLNKKGISFEILEKKNECGGLMRSLNEEGFTFDYGGSHVIFSKDTQVLNFMLSLLGDNKTKNRRNTKVLYKGHHVKYPFENGLADLPKKENYECLYYFVQNLIKREKEVLRKPTNLKDWFSYTFGKGIAEKYLIPYNKKIWKYPLEKIGLEWVERIPNPPIDDILKSSLGIKTEGYTHQLHFYYPKSGGIQALIKALEVTIKDHVITNFSVKKLRKEDGTWVVSDGKEERLYDKIISTIPVQNLVKATDCPNEVKTAAKDLKYNSLISVMLGLNTQEISDLSWLYIVNEDALPHRVSFPSNYSSNVAPLGKSSILAEITCTAESKVWKMNDEEIIKRVTDDLHGLKIINKKDICFAKTKRTEYAYVINDLKHNENARIVKTYTNDVGIDLVGRFAELEYMNMDDCIRKAMTHVEDVTQQEHN